MENEYTIKDEMHTRGIESKYFRTFYGKLKETNNIPRQDIIPRAQYGSIMDYLKTNGVIGQNGEVLDDGLKSFDQRIESEHGQRIHSLIRRLKESQDEKHRGFSKPLRKF